MSSVVFYAVLAIDYIAVAELSAAPLVDMQSAHTLASMADELSADRHPVPSGRAALLRARPAPP